MPGSTLLETTKGAEVVLPEGTRNVALAAYGGDIAAVALGDAPDGSIPTLEFVVSHDLGDTWQHATGISSAGTTSLVVTPAGHDLDHRRPGGLHPRRQDGSGRRHRDPVAHRAELVGERIAALGFNDGPGLLWSDDDGRTWAKLRGAVRGVAMSSRYVPERRAGGRHVKPPRALPYWALGVIAYQPDQHPGAVDAPSNTRRPRGRRPGHRLVLWNRRPPSEPRSSSPTRHRSSGGGVRTSTTTSLPIDGVVRASVFRCAAWSPSTRRLVKDRRDVLVLLIACQFVGWGEERISQGSASSRSAPTGSPRARSRCGRARLRRRARHQRHRRGARAIPQALAVFFAGYFFYLMRRVTGSNVSTRCCTGCSTSRSSPEAVLLDQDPYLGPSPPPPISG